MAVPSDGDEVLGWCGQGGGGVGARVCLSTQKGEGQGLKFQN
jgi:hypothetical protein